MNSIIGIAIKDIKTFFRERGTIFWTIAFPILIMLLFTAIFGREIPFTANVGVVNYDSNQAIPTQVIAGLNSSQIFIVKVYQNANDALGPLNRSEIRALITIPEGFSANLTNGLMTGQPAHVLLKVDETNPDIARIVRGGIQSFFSGFYNSFYEKALNKTYSTPISVMEESAVAGQAIGYKEYIVPGMLCYPLLFSSMVAATGAIVYEREKGTLKKIRASPARPLNVLFGKTLAALFQTAISILIMAVLAYFLLGPALNWNIPLLAPIMFLGSINGIALGLIISCVGRAPQEASNAATTIAIVLQFFIGMYFPAEYLPTYLQQVGSIIPMTYAAQAIRSVMIRNAAIGELVQPIITLVVSAAILFFIGILLYKRWVEKE
jgi:ABC-2 type transport system permease protein